MSTPFQNRLVGTVIVAALAIIVLPMVFDGKKNQQQASFGAIPPEPKVAFSDETKKFPTVQLNNLPETEVTDEQALDEQQPEQTLSMVDTEQVEVVQQAKSTKDKVTATDTKLNATTQAVAAAKQPSFTEINQTQTTSVKPNLAKSTPNKAWVIQLGSFKYQKSVDRLLSQLKAKGYTAFTRPIETSKGRLTKVYVGPELSKKVLEQQLDELKKLTNMQGKVAQFVVTN